MKEEMTKQEQSAVANYAITQIVHIAHHGCSGIKCKRCAINRMCKSKKPSDSKNIALQIISYAKTLPD